MISRFLKASKTLRNKFGGHPGQHARARKRKQRLLFEALEDRRLLAASPPLLTSIEGFNQDDNAFNTGDTLLQPPDPNGAVGLQHILNVGNASIQWFTKDGTPHYHTSLKNFFAPLRPDYGIFDPKALYDQYANRFIVVALEAYEVANGDLFDISRIMVAVSDDSDPNGTWYYHSINSEVNVPDPTTPAVNLRVLDCRSWIGTGRRGDLHYRELVRVRSQQYPAAIACGSSIRGWARVGYTMPPDLLWSTCSTPIRV